MLQILRVKNLALVESIRIDFNSGLNVITGETGAGKSILMGALGLLLGERADKSLIRTGEDACGAEALFHLSEDAEALSMLEELGLDPPEDGALILRRIVRVSGAGTNLVNDSPVTLQALKRLGECLVDMHGPHDHQSLLSNEAQRDILDDFGHTWNLRDRYAKRYEEWLQARKHREELLRDGEHIDEQIDLLSYKVNEIESANLNADEEEEILSEHTLSGDAQHILELAGQVAESLDNDEGGAYTFMVNGTRAMEQLSRVYPGAEAWKTELQQATRSVQEICASLANLADTIEANPERMEWLDRRLATYQSLKRKYGPETEDVLNELETSRTRLEELMSIEERLKDIDAAIQRALELVEQEGQALHDARTEAAQSLSTQIADALKELGFPHVEFSVELQLSEPGPSGLDVVDYGFAPNPGETMRPLRSIASAGEISRVMLAVKAVLSNHDRIPVLVFDEIDANLGGEMGGVVGEKLASVAKHHQVLCITHLPQVAVHGTTHFAVAKQVRDGRTFTEVLPLENEDRVGEIARMLGGRDQTTVTLEHARQMLEARTR